MNLIYSTTGHLIFLPLSVTLNLIFCVSLSVFSVSCVASERLFNPTNSTQGVTGQ